MVENIKTVLQVLGVLGPIALAMLAKRHAVLAGMLKNVLDAVEEVAHPETQSAVKEILK